MEVLMDFSDDSFNTIGSAPTYQAGCTTREQFQRVRTAERAAQDARLAGREVACRRLASLGELAACYRHVTCSTWRAKLERRPWWIRECCGPRGRT